MELWYVLSCLWDDGAYERYCQLKRVAHVVVAVGFLSDNLSGPLPLLCPMPYSHK